jgi:hypothetical protein
LFVNFRLHFLILLALTVVALSVERFDQIRSFELYPTDLDKFNFVIVQGVLSTFKGIWRRPVVGSSPHPDIFSHWGKFLYDVTTDANISVLLSKHCLVYCLSSWPRIVLSTAVVSAAQACCDSYVCFSFV